MTRSERDEAKRTAMQQLAAAVHGVPTDLKLLSAVGSAIDEHYDNLVCDDDYVATQIRKDHLAEIDARRMNMPGVVTLQQAIDSVFRSGLERLRSGQDK